MPIFRHVPQGDYDPFKNVQAEEKAARDADVPDIVPPTVAESLLTALERAYGPLPPAPPVTGATIRATCRFCHGQGCLSCDAQAEAEYRRQFPSGPEPLVTFHFNDPEDVQLMQHTLSADALRSLPTDGAQALQLLLCKIEEAVHIQQRLSEAPREDGA